jgi:hypothetical protein
MHGKSIENVLLYLFAVSALAAITSKYLWPYIQRSLSPKVIEILTRHRLMASISLIAIVVIGAYFYFRQPPLTGDIDATWIGDGAALRTRSYTLFAVRIRNRGPATALDNWVLKAKIPSGLISTARSILITSDITLGPGGRTFHPSDDLREKAAQPLQTGQILEGVILFTFSDVDLETLHNPLTEFMLSFKDVERNQYELKVIPGEHPLSLDDKQISFPGIPLH